MTRVKQYVQKISFFYNHDPTNNISTQYKKGFISVDTVGLDFAMEQNLRLHTCGNFGTAGAAVFADVVENTNTIVLDSFSGITGTPSVSIGDIFTITGELVRKLVKDYVVHGGKWMHEIPWGGKNDIGLTVVNGVYLIRVTRTYLDGTGRVTKVIKQGIIK